MPSTMTWPTWMPWGANSLARHWASARCANLADAKVEKPADLLSDPVAPVKMSVGGYLGDADADLSM